VGRIAGKLYQVNNHLLKQVACPVGLEAPIPSQARLEASGFSRLKSLAFPFYSKIIIFVVALILYIFHYRLIRYVAATTAEIPPRPYMSSPKLFL
jgi:hypothetical protein